MTQEALKAEFAESFALYGDAIFRFCIVKVTNREQAEDMTQEVFMRYWQYLRDGKEMTNTRSFLYTIANNLAKDWYKKKKSTSLDDRLEAGDESVLRSDDTSQELLAEYARVLDVIADMEEGDRTVLLLKYVDGLPPRDIAEILGETANAISVRINRAETRLQGKFEPPHHETK